MDETLEWYLDENKKLMCAIDKAIADDNEAELVYLHRKHRALMRGYWLYTHKDIPFEEIEAEHQEMVRRRRELRERLKK